MARPFSGLDDPRVKEAVAAFDNTGSAVDAGKLIGTSPSSIKRALDFYHKEKEKDQFDTSPLPDELPSAEELLERRRHEFERKEKAEEARHLIPVFIRIPGVIGVVHLGDPHLDDPGTDINQVERIIQYCHDQPDQALLAASSGDLQNNWIGRLSHLWGQQSTSAAEAWVLVEWFVNSLKWLYMVGGNHDAWSGAGDPLKWMMRQRGIFEYHGVRLALNFPNKKQVIVNARHDFTSGHSQWNPAHSIIKAAMMGWRDHILTAGHRHISGYQMVKDPASGLISHAIRIASFKIHDRFAKEKGLPNQNISPAVVTIIDPQYNDDDPRLITVLHDVQEGAEFLAWKRSKK